MKRIMLILFCIFFTLTMLSSQEVIEIQSLLFNSPIRDNAPCISADGLTLYFHSSNPSGFGGEDIWMVTRNDFNSNWQEPRNLGQLINTSKNEFSVSESEDGLNLYFSSDRLGGYGGYDLWVASRNSKNEDWNEPKNLGASINTEVNETNPSVSIDGLELYFSDYISGKMRAGGKGKADIWVAKRKSLYDDWESPINSEYLNSQFGDVYPELAFKDKVLIFGSDRPNGQGQRDLWISIRLNNNDRWSEPRNISLNINTSGNEPKATICEKTFWLYFSSDRLTGKGSMDIYGTDCSRLTIFQDLLNKLLQENL